MRLLYLAQIAHAPFFDLRIGDAKAYHDWAMRIAGGSWLGTDVFYQAPLYPYFLAVVYKTVGDGPTMIRFVQAVIGAGSCVLLAAAGINLFGKWGVIAGVLLAVYPPAIFLDGLLEKSSLVTFFTAALIYLLSASDVKFRGLLAGAVLGLLALTRENAILLFFPALAWLVTQDRRRLVAAFVAGCALVLLPVAARNYAVAGEFHLTTSQFGPNFYIGNHEGARGLYEPLVAGHGNAGDEHIDAVRLAEEASRRRLTAGEVSSFWTTRTTEFIRSHPGAWLRQLARKLALTFNAVEIADTESQDVYAEWSPLLRALSPFSFGVLFALAAFGASLTAAAWRRVWFLYAIALTYTLSVVMFYVFARYRFPLVPVLMLFAGGGLALWREPSARPRRWWSVTVLLAAAVVAYLPLADTRVDRVAHYVNIANTLRANSAKWDQAVVFYDKALAESPQSPAAHLGLGMLLADQHRPQDAVVHYRTAVEGWPDNADLRLNFALALAATGNTQGAFDQLEAADHLRPSDPTAHVIAGHLLLKESRAGDALKAYERALAIDPTNVEARTGVTRATELLREQK